MDHSHSNLSLFTSKGGIFRDLNDVMLLDPIYGYFDTHIAFLKGSGSGLGRTFVRFVLNLKVQVQVQVRTEPQIGGSLVH